MFTLRRRCFSSSIPRRAGDITSVKIIDSKISTKLGHDHDLNQKYYQQQQRHLSLRTTAATALNKSSSSTVASSSRPVSLPHNLVNRESSKNANTNSTTNSNRQLPQHSKIVKISQTKIPIEDSFDSSSFYDLPSDLQELQSVKPVDKSNNGSSSSSTAAAVATVNSKELGFYYIDSYPSSSESINMTTTSDKLKSMPAVPICNGTAAPHNIRTNNNYISSITRPTDHSQLQNQVVLNNHTRATTSAPTTTAAINKQKYNPSSVTSAVSSQVKTAAGSQQQQNIPTNRHPERDGNGIIIM